MRHRPWTRLVAAVAGGVGLALSAPMLAAVGQSSPPGPVLSIGPSARLVAQGAAVAVPVRVVVTCPPGTAANVNVQVAQAVGREVAHAFGSTNEIVCNGTPQTLEVFATSSDFTFRQGPAFVTANLFACGFSGGPFPGPFPGASCTAQAQREVTIVSGPSFPPPPPGFPPPPPPTFPPPTSPPPFLPPPPPTTPPTFPGFPGLPFPGFPDLSDLFSLFDFLDLIGFPFGASSGDPI